MTEWELFPHVAVATARAAQTLGITRVLLDDDELYQRAYGTIRDARESTHTLMREGLIPRMPRASE